MRQVPIVALAVARQAAYDAAIIGSPYAKMHGDCENPVFIDVRGQGSLLPKRIAALRDDPFLDWVEGPGARFLPRQALWHTDVVPDVRSVTLAVRCRKCPRCLVAKSRLWTARAFTEMNQSVRSWFCTLTVGPDRRFWAKAAAESLVANRWCETWADISEAQRFKAIERQLAPEVTRWLKRVRKNSGASLRYLLVSESHKDGFPHYHLILHEQGGSVTKRTLQDAWRWGFSRVNVVDQDSKGSAAWYVCKYLTKSAQARVRASRTYGQRPGAFITETQSGDASEAREHPACRVGKAKL